MPALKSLDPLDIASIHALVQKTSSLRMLALLKGRGRGKLVAYALKRPNPELEHDLNEQGAILVGYYTRTARVGQLMADIGAALDGT